MHADDEIAGDSQATPTTFILKEGQQHGPFTDAHITEALREGIYSYDDLCWREGMTDWQLLENIFQKQEPQTGILPILQTEPSQSAVSGTPRIPHAQFVARKWGLRGLPALCIGVAVVLLAIAVLYSLHGNHTIVGTWKQINHSHDRILVIDEKHYFEFSQENEDVVESFGMCAGGEGEYQLTGFDHKGAPVDFGTLELKWNGNELKIGDDIYSRTSTAGVTHPDIEGNYTSAQENAETKDAEDTKAQQLGEKNRVFYEQLMEDADEYARSEVQTDNMQNGIPSSAPAIGDLEAEAEQRWRVYESGDMKKRNFPDGYDSDSTKADWIKEYLTNYIAILKPLDEENQRKQAPAF